MLYDDEGFQQTLVGQGEHDHLNFRANNIAWLAFVAVVGVHDLGGNVAALGKAQSDSEAVHSDEVLESGVGAEPRDDRDLREVLNTLLCHGGHGPRVVRVRVGEIAADNMDVQEQGTVGAVVVGVGLTQDVDHGEVGNRVGATVEAHYRRLGGVVVRTSSSSVSVLGMSAGFIA
jgi:hypothetical protein